MTSICTTVNKVKVKESKKVEK